MGEAALAYEQEEFVAPAQNAIDENEYVVLMDGETDNDWKYGSD